MFYRDSLGWQVYPVHPPGAKCDFPGKQPAVRAWWDYDPQDCDVDARFHNGHPFNIGVAPKGGLVFIDLDSKPDQGASVQKFLAEHPELEKVPRHITRGGAHLVMICRDLPEWKAAKGKSYHGQVLGQINERVSAEIYHCERQNVVLPPSKHTSGFLYAWEAFGDVLDWPWDRLRELFCFVEPASREQRKKKGAPWHLQFRGELASLDLIALLKELGLHAELQDADDARYIIPCPWTSEHSGQGEADARIWQAEHRRPGFKCHHAHCGGRTIKDVLEWAEVKTPGIVDRFCARLRVWEEGQVSATGKVRILHAIARLESEVYTEVGKVIGPNHAWFVRANAVNVITQIPSGFTYSDDPNADFTVEAHTIGFSELDGIQAKGALEKYVEPGILVKEAGASDDDEPEFRPKSFTTDFCSGMIQSEQLKERLPFIARLLTVPLLFQIREKLVYPKTQYDPRFGTYLIPGAPEIYPMNLEKALEIIKRLHAGFCFTNEQSKTHAIARLITPFGRAMIGWTTRVPLWFYTANRPRAGKDYLAAIPILVYEGAAFEDLPIGKDPEETSKRIMAAARNGRRFMHFSNCQVYLQDQYLIQAITNPVINGRRLGSNDATSDLSIPNEMEFSISANVGLTYREDLGPRMRKIELAYFEEDPNSRTFADPFLHQTIKDNRSLVLSAISALYDNWCAKGFPQGKTRFTSFPKWAEIIGGVMTAAGLGDPCLPFQGKYDDNGGDNKTSSMLELFKVCNRAFKEEPIKKPQLYQCLQNEVADNELLSWFGHLEEA